MREFTEIRYPETVNILKNNKGFRTDIKCPNCDGVLVVRIGYKKFLGCSNYPNCTCKIGFNRPIEPIKFISDQMFHKDSYGIDSNYEDIMNDAYPSGINCKDDM